MITDGLAPNPFNKWPRNLDCYCGSGVKFKKCCADRIYPAIPVNILEQAKDEYEKGLKLVTKLKSDGIRYKLTEEK